MTGTRDTAELTFIAGRLLAEVAELALLNAGQWLGTGTWLARNLGRFNPDLLWRLTQGSAAALSSDDYETLRVVVLEILESAGGPLSGGYRRDEPREFSDSSVDDHGDFQ